MRSEIADIERSQEQVLVKMSEEHEIREKMDRLESLPIKLKQLQVDLLRTETSLTDESRKIHDFTAQLEAFIKAFD